MVLFCINKLECNINRKKGAFENAPSKNRLKHVNINTFNLIEPIRFFCCLFLISSNVTLLRMFSNN